MNKNNILILCKVVDNYGDIGTAFRLAKALSRLRENLNISIVVSDLDSFSALFPKINPEKKIQQVEYGRSRWNVIDWNFPECESFARGLDFGIILECFQCGRPEWLENILFSDDFKKIVQIVNIDYLTAEEYADDFHLLKSGTRKSLIRKINFMPGFTKNTGGLILESKKELVQKNAFTINFDENFFSQKRTYDILIFSYERDFSSIVQAINRFEKSKKEKNSEFSVRVLVAAGKSEKPFLDAWEKSGKPFRAEVLDFLPQEKWDEIICSCGFVFVRGEDSLSRACLSGVPFIWHAYVQDDDYQLVKVSALLGRMKPFFSEDDFAVLEKVWLDYNKSLPEKKDSGLESEKIELLLGSESVRKGFGAFALSLWQNGDLAQNLLDYIDSLEA